MSMRHRYRAIHHAIPTHQHRTRALFAHLIRRPPSPSPPSDRAVSLAELAQAHGTIARVAAVGGGSLWKALVEFAFEQPSSAWTDFVATVTDQAVLSVLTDGPAKPEDAWRVIDAWAAYAGGTGAAGGEL